MGPRERLALLTFAYMPAQLVHVMARMGLADLLADGSRTIDELSAGAGADPQALRRVARGLASIGLLELDGDRLSVTEIGALLGAQARGSMREVALHGAGEGFKAWGELDHTVRTGKPAFEEAYGEPFFAYIRARPEAGAAFDGMMTQLSRRVIGEAVESYDFGAASRVLDVGGGQGHFLAAVLTANPDLQGAVFDVPEVVESASRHLADQNLADRCKAIGGSFFESLPADYDLHILKWILHDWNDESCKRILMSCHEALAGGGRLLVVEQLLPDDTPEPGLLHPAIASDLTMLVNFADARERTLDEYADVLTSGGFHVHDVVSLPSGFSILDARPD